MVDPSASDAGATRAEPPLREGQLFGISWCCTLDADGQESNVAFGLTRNGARVRCMRNFSRAAAA